MTDNIWNQDSEWHKSAHSPATCVRTRRKGGMVEVSNSNRPNDPISTFTPDEWVAFVKGVKDGEFDQG